MAMREITFSQTHRRTHRRRNIVVSQFDAAPNAGLAWHYITQTGSDGPWTAFRLINVAPAASDDDVVMAVVRDLASLGWDRDATVVPAL